MANPTKISGKNGLKIEFGTIDNAVDVIMTTDSAAGGYAEPFSFNSAGMGSPNPDCEVDLDYLLQSFKKQGVSSVFLMVVGTNYIGGGSINFEIEDGNGASVAKVNTNLPTFTSKQWAYQVAL